MALISLGYKIEHPAFTNVVFSASSPDHLAWPAAVAFARERDGVLQSAREAAAFRVEANGVDNANLYQATRTVVAYIQVNGKWYGAVDDSADPEQNIVLARADEGYTAHNNQGKWVLPKTDNHVRGILERAQRTDRVFVVSEQSPLELATTQKEGVSAFGAHAGIRAILGSDDLPEAYASFLDQKGKRRGRFYNLTSQTLDQLSVGNDNAEIRLVGLGGSGYDYLDYVGAYNRCCVDGRARGVRLSEPAKRDAP